MIDKVFVYGTLNPESPFFNAYIVQDDLGVTEWVPATATGTRIKSGGAWDYVWFHEGGEPMEGVILTLPNPKSDLRLLDQYEGFYGPNPHFVRKEITVRTLTREDVRAWGYEWGRDLDTTMRQQAQMRSVYA